MAVAMVTTGNQRSWDVEFLNWLPGSIRVQRLSAPPGRKRSGGALPVRRFAGQMLINFADRDMTYCILDEHSYALRHCGGHQQ
jgi:hypothetical protein